MKKMGRKFPENEKIKKKLELGKFNLKKRIDNSEETETREEINLKLKEKALEYEKKKNSPHAMWRKFKLEYIIKQKIINTESIKELVAWMLISFISFIIFESISRMDISKAFYFMQDKPQTAFLNYLLFMICFSPVIFVKHKKAFYYIIFAVLTIFACTNAVVLNFRGMPIGFSDLYSYKEAIRISSHFISKGLIMGIIAIIVAVIALFIVIFRLSVNEKRITGIFNIFLAVIILISYNLGVNSAKANGQLNRIAWNPALSYQNNGTLYSFSDSLFGFLRKKPEGYSKEAIEKIRKEVDEKEKQDKRKIDIKDAPNIIYVQLEAFMYPERIPGVKLSGEDPMPVFRSLMKNNVSGYANVPVTGGGTARTEFEVLTGFNFDYLIEGEIPYMTIVNHRTMPSEATNLRRQGYYANAIHNFESKFYNRNNGYKNLGIERFVSLEFMNGYTMTDMGWPKDYVLADYIPALLDKSKDKKDFIMGVSVQGHSKYPSNPLDKDYPVKVSGIEKESDRNQIEYYTEQVREMDQFIEMLIKNVNSRKEKTLILFYGDHLPGLKYLRDNEDKIDLYSTVFTYYANYRTPEFKDLKDIEAYDFGYMTNYLAGTEYSPMDKVNAYLRHDKDFKKKQELVQYDILFGKQYFLKKGENQGKNKIKMGLGDIKIKGIDWEDNKNTMVVKGDNFTIYSHVFVNGKKVESERIDEHTMKVQAPQLQQHNTVRIVQECNESIVGKSEPYTFNVIKTENENSAKENKKEADKTEKSSDEIKKK